MKNKIDQKKINHVCHYTKRFDILIRILKNGFVPSYCLENINDFKYYIPMVSFCNIPFSDVNLYLHYGEYGIGMSLDWALNNSISPVVYIHKTTPFRNIHAEIKFYNHKNMIDEIFDCKPFDEVENNVNNYDYDNHTKKSNELNEIAVSAIQFYKNWETEYRNQNIRTYQEREWRFIPKLKEKKIISEIDDDFKSIEKKDKPHLPMHVIKLADIESIRYILIKNENQREKILNELNKKFGEAEVRKSILSGKLMIFTKRLINNDF
jgi:hypothetical protein